jgi:hypothetical protein
MHFPIWSPTTQLFNISDPAVQIFQVVFSPLDNYY